MLYSVTYHSIAISGSRKPLNSLTSLYHFIQQPRFGTFATKHSFRPSKSYPLSGLRRGLSKLSKRAPVSQAQGTNHSFLDPYWSWNLGHKPFARLGNDTIMVVAPGGIIFSTCDPRVITEVASRRWDFVKPIESYVFLDLWVFFLSANDEEHTNPDVP
jgi:hypothetical protein